MVEGEIMTWSVPVDYCVLCYVHIGYHARACYRSLLDSESGFGSSSISIRRIIVVMGPTVVRSWVSSSNSVRYGISIPLVIISSNISSASSIPLMVVDP